MATVGFLFLSSSWPSQFSGVGQSRRPLWAATSPGNLGRSREQGKGSTEWELDGTGEGGRDKDVLLCP